MSQRTKSKINRYTVTAFSFAVILLIYFISMITQYNTIQTSILKSVKATQNIQDHTTLDVMKSFISGTESALNSKVPNRFDLINVNGLFNRLILKKKIDDVNDSHTVYKLNNGQLTYHYREYGMRIAHKNMSVLKQYCTSVGTQLLYIQAPYKVDKYNNQLPYGLPDYPNVNGDKFLEGLDKLKIDYIDLREVIHQNNFVYEDLFFITDHHWKTETGFWAYTYIMEYLRDRYGVTYDERNTDATNFTFTTMEQSFIGSLANRVGTLYAGVDDFTYIYPNFETSFTWTKYLGNGTPTTQRVGSFYDTILFDERTKNADIPLAYRDNIYFNGNPAIAKITNDEVDEGRVLVIQDSFGKPVSSFLALNFHQVDVMDLRDYNEMTVLDYLKMNEKYDYVFVLYNPSVFQDSSYYLQFRFYDYK